MEKYYLKGLTDTNKKLINKDNKEKLTIYKDRQGKEGVSMVEAWGVLSGAQLIYLNQLNMECFDIE